ncbi:hypothetical protein [Methylocapsa sp. S129]|uniref:hypothetical protein n=1 Tax=Methylocapsa sp. S129 TaxID=1641869 RepID=UPI00131CCD33|nr:hypothetical protein [Methylocapsa sp. S129]
MARFKWRADCFDGVDKAVRSVRTATIQADNADEAAKIAKAHMGSCKRVEVRRVATTAPAQVIYAREELAVKTVSLTEILSWARTTSTAPA